MAMLLTEDQVTAIGTRSLRSLGAGSRSVRSAISIAIESKTKPSSVGAASPAKILLPIFKTLSFVCLGDCNVIEKDFFDVRRICDA
jgi:hypothetical protein